MFALTVYSIHLTIFSEKEKGKNSTLEILICSCQRHRTFGRIFAKDIGFLGGKVSYL